VATWRIVLAIKTLFVPFAAVAVIAGTPAAAGAAPDSDPIHDQTSSRCYSDPSADHCDRTDPDDTGCADDAYTVKRATLWFRDTLGRPSVPADATVELRYSPHCKTNWSRVTVHSGRHDGLVTVGLCRGRGTTDCVDQYSAYNTWAYSDQLYAPKVVATAFGWCCSGNGSGGAYADVSA
jgi:hypothetical protein